LKNELKTAFQYVDDVVSGKIITGDLVKKNVERFIYLYDHGKDIGVNFNEKKAQHNLAFFDHIKHHKGSFARRNDNRLILSGWQAYAQAYTFGFYREEPHEISGNIVRLVQDSYIEVAKKNGKTVLGAGNCCYMVLADGEPGAEVYIVAPTYDQSYRAYMDCQKFINNSNFKKYCRVMARGITVIDTKTTRIEAGSYIHPLSSDPDSFEGKFANMALLDEVHIIKDNLPYENLKSGGAIRDSPLVYMITTAGYDRESFCYNYRKRVINNLYEEPGSDPADHQIFGMIHTLDEGDDYEDPANWPKANPQIGISIAYDTIAAQIRSIKQDPVRFEGVLTKHLNIWVDSPKSFITAEIWKRTEMDLNLEDFRGCKVYGGLDLAETDDLTAYVLLIEDADGKQYLYPRFYLPEKRATELTEQKIFNMKKYAADKKIFLLDSVMFTPEVLLQHIQEDADRFDYQMLGCDPWRSKTILHQCQQILGKYYDAQNEKYNERFQLVAQRPENLSPTMQELYRRAHLETIFHFPNAVLDWNIRNTRIKKDWNDNWRAYKDSDNEKIDGTLGCMMAIWSRMKMLGQIDGSIYDERDVLTA
jgi:phage terminase large subunit-like protein